MKRVIPFTAGLLVAALGWLILQKFELPGWAERAERGGEGFRPVSEDRARASQGPSAGAIRIASFGLDVFTDAKASKPRVQDILSRIARQFDVLALQGVCVKNQEVLPTLLELANRGARHYDYLTGPRLGPTEDKEQYVYFYDRDTIEVDRSQSYTVSDPDDLLRREPLVAWFRVRGPPANRAFTFSLVNVHLDAELRQQELDVLASVYRAVRDDGRHEDDVIILGDLGPDVEHLGRLGKLPGMTLALIGQSTDTRGTEQLDNILFCLPATTEYTGRSGVFDFLREYNLSLEEALEISTHLPIWAEFSLLEGGPAHNVAERVERRSRE